MAGSITVSKGKHGAKGVTISVGSEWYTLVVDAARQYFPASATHYVEQIYGEGDEGFGDWADLREVSAEGFNIFYRAIRRSIEAQARCLFDSDGRSRPTPFGTYTDSEIIAKLEADPRFDSRV
ncbi:hypothetical protein RT97_11640 [Variovorax paradoxus]|uniref:Uncharacterized protein n=1 Tax=Variovorax paradoxus TaxID=34073 RepID=A0A0D0MU45_VARPD|nr:hypothetical protein [Variovorax paradoxus]KIQ32705.1 hypothetical protein RT97_11640 [Variovorax paradoxus]